VAIVTISRQFGSNGEMIAEILAKATDCLLLNRKTLEETLSQHHIPEIRLEWINESSPYDIEGLEDERLVYLEFLKDTISSLSEKRHVFLLGRGGQFLFKDKEDAYHIKVIASLDTRADKIQQRFDVDKATALRLINQKDAERDEYTLFFHRSDSSDPHAYDLIVNTSKVSIEEAAEIILFFLTKKGVFSSESFSAVKTRIGSVVAEKLAISHEAQPYGRKAKPPSRDYVFANESEEEFARILDYYKIDYLYEPTTFPLRWDSEGNVESAFTPDFYFPEFDFYIELTTMKQELVTKKNRKLRELRSVYPDINIRLFYRKDFNKLLERFGISVD
jgi:cytidylate kinase